MIEQDILAARILIVDDVEANLRLFEDLLAREGFTQMLGLRESASVLELASAFAPDLIVLDLHMPGVDGHALLESLVSRRPEHDYLPILVVTADASRAARHRALALGAKDFLTKPFDPIEAMLRVWNLLETRMLYRRLHALAGPPESR